MAGAMFWFLPTRIGMRGIVLAAVAIQIGLAHPAVAEDAVADRPIGQMLPLFEKNHCDGFKDPAEQMFCGDPELYDASLKQNKAIQDRLNRIPNRRLAIKEEAEWINGRNPSCRTSS